MEVSLIDYTNNIKKNNDLILLFKENGIEFNEKGLSYCPFHKDTRKTLKINVKDQEYQCGVCYQSGDIIDLIMFIKNFNFWQALEYLSPKDSEFPFKDHLEESIKRDKEMGRNNNTLSTKLDMETILKYPDINFKEDRYTRYHIINNYPITGLVEVLGYKTLPSHYLISPHRANKKPTIKIYPRLNLFRDYTNKQWRGDLVDFIMKEDRTLSLEAAIRKVEKLIKSGKISRDNYQKEYNFLRYSLKYLNSDVYNFTDRYQVRAYQEYYNSPYNYTEELMAWELLTERIFTRNLHYQKLQQLCNGLASTTLKYLTGPKGQLTIETIEKFKLFSINFSAEKYFEELIKTDESLLTAELIDHLNKFIHPEHTLIIPYYENEKIINLRGKRFHNSSNTSPQGGSNYHGLVRDLGDLRMSSFYNLNVTNELSENDPLLICDNEFETMVADQLGYKAIGLISEYSVPLDELDIIESFDIYVILRNNRTRDYKLNNIKGLFSKPYKVITLKKHDSLIELNIKTKDVDLFSDSEFIEITDVNN